MCRGWQRETGPQEKGKNVRGFSAPVGFPSSPLGGGQEVPREFAGRHCGHLHIYIIVVVVRVFSILAGKKRGDRQGRGDGVVDGPWGWLCLASLAVSTLPSDPCEQDHRYLVLSEEL